MTSTARRLARAALADLLGLALHGGGGLGVVWGPGEGAGGQVEVRLVLDHGLWSLVFHAGRAAAAAAVRTQSLVSLGTQDTTTTGR